MISAPTMPFLALAVVVYALMGSGRRHHRFVDEHQSHGADTKHFMGTGENTFYFAGTLLQVAAIVSGWKQCPEKSSRRIFVIALVYAIGFCERDVAGSRACNYRRGMGRSSRTDTTQL